MGRYTGLDASQLTEVIVWRDPIYETRYKNEFSAVEDFGGRCFFLIYDGSEIDGEPIGEISMHRINLSL